MSYSVLYEVYDDFSSADILKKCDFLSKVFKDKNCKILLDVGCGSGLITKEMAQRGYSMIGVDSSEEMLSKAKENNAEYPDVLLLSQPAEKLDLYGTVDGAFAVCDVVNHITDKKKLQKAFNRISLFLMPGGYFVFDVNTKHKFENVLANNTFYYENEESSLIWQNDYNEKSGLCSFDLTLFSRENGESYKKSNECFFERFYSDEELTEMLNLSGFEVKQICGGEYASKRKPLALDERKIFIAKKIR